LRNFVYAEDAGGLSKETSFRFLVLAGDAGASVWMAGRHSQKAARC